MADTEKSPIINDEHPFTLEKWNKALIELYEWGVDDILLQDGELLAVQRKGRIVVVGNRPLELDTVSNILNGMYKSSAAATLQKGDDHNFTYPVRKDRTTVYRFRVNGTGTLGMYSSPVGVDVTMRAIAQIPPTMDQLKVPQELRQLLFPRTGLVIVGGATGSGKSTLLGSVIRYILTAPEGRRVLSYESPIEFDFRAIQNRTGRIAQSDVYIMLKDYAHATANSLRRHPNDILLGEARDAETIQGAIHNAETGHRVYSTVHVNSVGEMITRMVGVFPHQDQPRAISGLIGAARTLIYQELIPTLDGGRTAIQEWLSLDDDMRRTLYGTKAEHLTQVIAGFVRDHGRPLIRDVTDRYREGVISKTQYDQYAAEFSNDLGVPSEFDEVREHSSDEAVLFGGHE